MSSSAPPPRKKWIGDGTSENPVELEDETELPPGPSPHPTLRRPSVTVIDDPIPGTTPPFPDQPLTLGEKWLLLPLIKAAFHIRKYTMDDWLGLVGPDPPYDLVHPTKLSPSRASLVNSMPVRLGAERNRRIEAVRRGVVRIYTEVLTKREGWIAGVARGALGPLRELKDMNDVVQVKSRKSHSQLKHNVVGYSMYHDEKDPQTGQPVSVYDSIVFDESFVASQSSADVLDTALHELAHYIIAHCGMRERVKDRNYHGNLWVALAKELGCSGNPTHSLDTLNNQSMFDGAATLTMWCFPDDASKDAFAYLINEHQLANMILKGVRVDRFEFWKHTNLEGTEVPKLVKGTYELITDGLATEDEVMKTAAETLNRTHVTFACPKRAEHPTILNSIAMPKINVYPEYSWDPNVEFGKTVLMKTQQPLRCFQHSHDPSCAYTAVELVWNPAPTTTTTTTSSS